MSEEKRNPFEEVCRMLDERGIDYTVDDSDDYEVIEWSSAYNLWWQFVYDPYEEMPYGELRLLEAGGSTHLTPEQAIAATVGNSTDLSKRLREVHGLHEFAELFGFDWTGESDWDWHDVACAMADAVDVATVGRSCASCPEMDNPDSYIVHLHRVLEVADEGVGTCHMRLAYEEEDADGFIWPDHYECDACGAKVNGIMPFYDTEIPPKYCPNCRARVIKED